MLLLCILGAGALTSDLLDFVHPCNYLTFWGIHCCCKKCSHDESNRKLLFTRKQGRFGGCVSTCGRGNLPLFCRCSPSSPSADARTFELRSLLLLCNDCCCWIIPSSPTVYLSHITREVPISISHPCYCFLWLLFAFLLSGRA